MTNKVISLFNISLVVGLLISTSQVNAAYYHDPDIPDYDVVTMPCYVPHRPAMHHHVKHHAKKHAKSHYHISTYYVFRSINGDVLWIPSSGCCNGTWVTVRCPASNPEFCAAPYGRVRDIDNVDDNRDYDMDMRTSDDVDNVD